MPDDPDSSNPLAAERVADPTPLTTAALLREVGHIRIEIASAISNVNTRIAAMDKAVALFKDDLVRVPTDTDKQIASLKEKINNQIECLKDLLIEKFKTVEEKFSGIAKQFQLNEIAVTAALSTAKEAVGKQNESSNLATSKAETASMKQMDQMRDIVNTSIGGLNDKIDITGNRMTTIEGQVSNLLQTVAQLRAVPPVPMMPTPQQTNLVPYLMGGVVIMLLVVILIFEFMSRGALR